MASDISGVSVFGNPVWFLRILRQEGLRAFSSRREGKSADSTSLVCANFANVIFPNTTHHASDAPRVLISSHRATARHLGLKVRKKKAQFFSFDGASHVVMSTLISSIKVNELGDLQEFGFHLDSNGNRIEGSGIIILHEPGRVLISLPWDFSRTPENNKLIPTYLERSWGTGIGISEVSPGIDSMAVRKAVFFMIRLAHQITNSPLVRLSPRPSGPPVNIVRIDADGFTKGSTQAVLSVSEKMSIPFSWFIDLMSWRNSSGDLLRISDRSEVGVHCYHHLTFTTRRQNKVNLELASVALEKLGIRWTGAVAPHGTWNKGLSLALEDQGVCYSSEFAASEEDLPFTINGVLQIPTPPYSLGVWTDGRDYWRYVQEQAKRQHEDQGVAILYDHPVGRLENHIDAFEAYLSKQKDKGARFITMGEYCLMWLKRESELSGDASMNPSTSSCVGELANQLDIGSDKEYFSQEKIDCSADSLTKGKFAEIKSSTSGIQQSRWRIVPSIYLFLLGLVPLSLHLFWTHLRKRLVHHDSGSRAK